MDDVNGPDGAPPHDDGEVAESPPEPVATQAAWRLAVGALAVATAVAVVVAAVVLLPAAGGAAGDAAGWVAGAVDDGADAAADVWDRWANRLQEVASDSLAAPAEPAPPPAGSASALVVASDEAGLGVAFALVAVAPDGEATVVLAPPDLLAILPGYGDFRLAESVQFEGPELAALTLTNLLGVRIDEFVLLEPGDLQAALGGPEVLDLPSPLIVPQGDEGRVLANSGRAERPALIVEEVLTTQGLGDQLEWLARQGAVWEALLAAVAADPAVADRLAASAGARADDVAAVLRAAAATEVGITAVPVTRVAVGGDDVRYTLAGDGEDFAASRLGHLLLADGERLRIEILNGNGRVGTTRVVAEQLARRGFRVVRTDNAARFDYPLTQVVAQGRENRVAAEEVLRLIGSGELLLELRNPSGVVDISIIVGQDVPAGESG